MVYLFRVLPQGVASVMQTFANPLDQGWGREKKREHPSGLTRAIADGVRFLSRGRVLHGHFLFHARDKLLMFRSG